MLEAREQTLKGITTDGSPLYPSPIPLLPRYSAKSNIKSAENNKIAARAKVADEIIPFFMDQSRQSVIRSKLLINLYSFRFASMISLFLYSLSALSLLFWTFFAGSRAAFPRSSLGRNVSISFHPE